MSIALGFGLFDNAAHTIRLLFTASISIAIGLLDKNRQLILLDNLAYCAFDNPFSYST